MGKINKKKLFNDPVYGFIGITDELIFDIIEHPFFQRLRRIKQLGLTHLVYPGAFHSRFHHSLGAMHLMQQAISVLQSKGHSITKKEQQAALIAILLHDIGHGPFSHALEKTIVNDTSHEDISLLFMEDLNKQFNEQLTTGISIFKGDYKKHFLTQLVSSQLDMDRLDYLTRDSFFTGVSEGVIGTDRLIKMLELADGNIAAEAKGIYSIEKFIISRRIMYWQVYLHKTVIAAEYMLINILKRAQSIAKKDPQLFASPALSFFLKNNIMKKDFMEDKTALQNFARLDDFDIFSAIKVWAFHEDRILSKLCTHLVNRQLFRCEIQNEPFEYFYMDDIRNKTAQLFDLKEDEIKYFVYSDTTSNSAYNLKADKINILYKTGKVEDITDASDQLNISVFSQAVTKHFLCYPKQITDIA
jgi:hypothetical protein